jgi:hypothetical protein
MRNTLATLAVLVCLGCGGHQDDSTASTSSSSTSGSTTSESTDSTASTGTGSTEAASEPRIVVGTDACTTDADCVPDACCHAAACVAAANRPSCADAVCTQECRYGTLDCGGSCLCHEGHCAARLSALPNVPGVPGPQ